MEQIILSLPWKTEEVTGGEIGDERYVCDKIKRYDVILKVITFSMLFYYCTNHVHESHKNKAVMRQQ